MKKRGSSMRPEKVARLQELRRSNAAGTHKNKRDKRFNLKNLINKEREDQ